MNFLRYLLWRLFERLAEKLAPPCAASISIHFNRKGSHKMPANVGVGQTIPAFATEASATGANVPILNPGAISWTTSDSTIASVFVNADGTATFTGVAAGTVTVTVSDSSNSLTSSDQLTVVGQVATTIAIQWGTPVAATV